MMTLKRYTRAFVKALKMTLEGNAIQPTEVRYPNLTKWIREGLQLVDQTLKTAEAQGMDEAARQAIMLKIDGRNMSMDVILQAVRHNMSMEYPMLLDTLMEHNLTTLYAINMNDQYHVNRLAEADELAPEVQASIQKLANHLQNIPSSKEP